MKCPKENSSRTWMRCREPTLLLLLAEQPDRCCYTRPSSKNSSPSLEGWLSRLRRAYALFIKTPGVPTDFRDPRRREVRHRGELLFKYAGFTGARLGWTVVPDPEYSDGSKVRDDFNRS